MMQHSMGLGEPPGMEDVLGCVKNIRQVGMLLQQPGRRFRGPEGKDMAATCIQSHWRCGLLEWQMSDHQQDAASVLS